MSPPLLDEDAMVAAIDLVQRSGASECTYGYLHDNVPIEEAAWWAEARYSGARIIAEGHRGPVEALEALARKLLTGAMCSHCRALIALGDDGAVVYPGSARNDGSVWTDEEIRRVRRLPQCRYRRVGPKWVRGCELSQYLNPGRGKRGKRDKRPKRRRT